MKRAAAFCFMISLVLLLCACGVWPKEPAPTPIPWPAELLPNDLPVLRCRVLSVSAYENTLSIEARVDTDSVEDYMGELEELGYTRTQYSGPPEAIKDDVKIYFEGHGAKQVCMMVTTLHEQAERLEGAVIENGRLVIALRENPTTGYVWSYSIEHESMLRLLSEEYISEDASGEVDGGGGVHIFSFKGLDAGKTELIFEQTRGGDDVFGKVVFSVVVDKDGVIESADRIADAFG